MLSEFADTVMCLEGSYELPHLTPQVGGWISPGEAVTFSGRGDFERLEAPCACLDNFPS